MTRFRYLKNNNKESKNLYINEYSQAKYFREKHKKNPMLFDK